jgi:hypothetical protein
MRPELLAKSAVEETGLDIPAFMTVKDDAKLDVSKIVEEIWLDVPRGTIKLYTSAKLGPPSWLQVELSGLYPPQNSEGLPTQGILHLEANTGPPIYFGKKFVQKHQSELASP